MLDQETEGDDVSGHVTYFGVRVQGKNLSPRGQAQPKRWLRWFSPQAAQPGQLEGFFTTRFVMAFSANQAIEFVLNMVATEVRQLVFDCRWEFDAIDPWPEEKRSPQAGCGAAFTWYGASGTRGAKQHPRP